MRKGGELEDDRRTLEAEAAVKIHKIDMDLQEYLKTREEELERERKLFGTKLAQQRDRIALDIELRKQELEKLKADRKKEFQAVGELPCLKPHNLHHIPYTIYHIPYTLHHTSYTIHHHIMYHNSKSYRYL
ncbi:hypothetical protein EON64_00030 [archaeon]|nr:MAG: hypothetical protein EON64_00030 [archaeon]